MDERSSTVPVTRLNHAVLYVRDVERSVAFYTDVLGFRRIDMTPDGFRGAAFLQAPGSTNDHDLGLFEIGAGAGPSGAGRATVGLYHLAWEVDTLGELERLAGALSAAGALVGTSDHGTT
ncbi:MAG TPA: VOC family protein, partial [Acidimicrobiales bacterium]|nr:VOC family protein [Acidimicrobiales bacterium]